RWGAREARKYHLICGLGGAALPFVSGMSGSVVGASAAVFGIMLAFAMNCPNAPIYIWGIFPVPAQWLVAILAAMALLSAMSGARDGVAHLAHLGGFAAGFLYLRLSDPVSIRLARLKKMIPKRRFTVIPRSEERRVGRETT